MVPLRRYGGDHPGAFTQIKLRRAFFEKHFRVERMSRFFKLSVFVPAILFVLYQGAIAGDPDKGSVRLGTPGKLYLDITVSGIGDGTIRVSPLEAQCRRSDSLCTYGFDPGTKVILRAEPAKLDSRFDGWIGNCEPEEPEKKEVCHLIMNEDKSITAVFSRSAGISFP